MTTPDDAWVAVDAYVGSVMVGADAALDAALSASDAGGLPPIQVSAAQGKFLQLLARMVGAKRILEIGTLGGYSTIWLARALSASGATGGKLVSLEISQKHADIARANVARAGLSSVVDIQVGRAIDLLPGLIPQAPFDFVFIDADKASIASYFEWAINLSRRGSAILVDNVVPGGGVVNPTSGDESIEGVRAFNQKYGQDPRVSMTTLQTVGAKGYDGFTLAIVT